MVMFAILFHLTGTVAGGQVQLIGVGIHNSPSFLCEPIFSLGKFNSHP